MDYFSVIVLILVTLIFVSDRNIKSLEKIECEDANILEKVRQIRSNIDIVSVKNINYKNILANLKDNDKEYILLHNNKIQLDEYKIQTLISNYITCNQRMCGFNLLYIYSEKQQRLKRIYLEIINYLNIFNRKEIATYGIIVGKKIDLKQNEGEIKKQIICYTPSKITYIELKKEEISTERLKNIYLDKIRKSNLGVVLKILLLIISGSIITTNLIYSLLNVNKNINNCIISLVIYYCYSYIIRYIYKPVGKQRVVASYIFPIYFILYVFVGLVDCCARVIKNVQAS